MAVQDAKILILGGGFGGLFSALDLAGAGDVTLVSDEDHFLFKPMLYEYLSGEVEAWHIAPDYRELLDERVRSVRGKVTKIDLKSRLVTVSGRAEPFVYDALVLALGAVTNYAGVAGAEALSLPFRTLADANNLRRLMTEALDSVQPDAAPQDTRDALTFAVVGGGASGVELSTKMADLLRDAFPRRALNGEPRVLVIEMGDKVVPGMGDEIREFVTGALGQSRVEIHTLTRVVRVTQTSVTIEHAGTQTEIPTAAVVWVGGVQVNPLLDKLDL